MDNLNWSTTLLEEAQYLHRESEKFGHYETSGQIQIRLFNAINRQDKTERTVLRVALWGGTGVGKSTLLNALTGLPLDQGASEERRGYTYVPRISTSHDDQPLVSEWGEIVNNAADGAPTLIDCPDIDSIKEANMKAAEEIITRTDVVVYVTSPDKYANFEITEQLKKWSSQKRWFFVINKADTLESQEDQGIVRTEFLNRIRELGFRPDPDNVFLISAINKNHDFGRLYKVLFSARSVERIKALSQENLLKRLVYAFEEKLLQPLKEAEQRLSNADQKLREKTKLAYQNAFSGNAETVLVNLKHERIWQKLPPHVHGSMAFVAILRTRFGQITTAISTSRLLSRGRGLTALARMIWTSTGSFISDRYIIRKLLTDKNNELKHELEDVKDEARRELEDVNIAPTCMTALTTVTEDDNEKGIEEESVFFDKLNPMSGLLPRKRKKDNIDSLSEQIDDAIDSAATDIASAFPFLRVILVNAIPLFVLGVFLFRLVEACIYRNYESSAFFLNYIGLFAAAHLPGYIFTACWVKRKQKTATDSITESITQAAIPGPFETIRTKLTAFIDNVHRFRKKTNGYIVALSKELNTKTFGTSWIQDDEE